MYHGVPSHAAIRVILVAKLPEQHLPESCVAWRSHVLLSMYRLKHLRPYKSHNRLQAWRQKQRCYCTLQSTNLKQSLFYDYFLQANHVLFDHPMNSLKYVLVKEHLEIHLKVLGRYDQRSFQFQLS
ncbi:Uncharacterised protein [Acinetobacter baumannii]|nr:Uncharacterised protein [Acinetobacter baumannii]